MSIQKPHSKAEWKKIQKTIDNADSGVITDILDSNEVKYSKNGTTDKELKELLTDLVAIGDINFDDINKELTG